MSSDQPDDLIPNTDNELLGNIRGMLLFLTTKDFEINARK